MLIKKRSGMALVIVMGLAAAVLVMADAYLRSFSSQSGQNNIELGAIQADLLAEGITQIAMLKLKELPAPIYYATLCKSLNPGIEGADEPLNVYNSDPILQGKLTSASDGFAAEYRTSFQCLPSKLYENINAKITVQVQLVRPDNKAYNRVIERTITGDRQIAANL